jgi:polyisoprenoid-binding protein YceI
MNILRNLPAALSSLAILFILALPFQSTAQSKYSTNGTGKVVVSGTSNIHDWKLTSAKGTCTGTFTVDGAGALTSISGLSFSVSVSTLKSEHGSQMDNNAYKAMGAEKNPNITFSSSNATITPKGGNTYSISAPGKLQISSGTKDVTLVATGKVNADKSVSIDGSYNLVTTDYNVKAISIMLGAIKTSPKVTVNYSLVMKPQ